jgi:hypothetical protein
MSKKTNPPEGRLNLKKARKTISKFDSGLPPDIPSQVVVDLLNNLGIDYRTTKEGLLIDGCLPINFQHRNGKFTVHRGGFSQALKYARTKSNEM